MREMTKGERFFKCLTLAVCTLVCLAVLQLQYFVVLPVLLLVGIGLLCYRVDIKGFSLLLFLGSMALSILVVLVIETPPTSDFSLILSASQSLLEGDMSFNQTGYFQRWAYQSVWVVSQSAILWVWNDILAIKVVNCLMYSLCNVLFYHMASAIFSKKSSQIISVFHLFFIFHMTFVTVLANSIASTFLMYLGVYLVLCQKPKGVHPLVRYALAGVSISLGNLLRAEGVIVVLAILAALVIEFTQNVSKKRLLEVASKGLVLLVAYFLVATVAAQLIVATGVNENGLDNGDPLWKLVTGTNHETGGQYSDADWTRIAAMEEEGIPRTQAEWSIIKERLLVSPSQLTGLFTDKIENFWSADSIYWSLGYLANDYPDLYEEATQWNRQVYQITLLLALAGVLELWRKRDGESGRNCLIPLIVLATFFCYLIVEVQSRYGYFVQWGLFFLACGGLDFLGRGLPSRRDKDMPTPVDVPQSE